MFRVDQTGLELILGFEGYRDVVYPDSRGLATVGVGHLLHYSAPTAQDHRRYDHKGRQFYLDLLAQDVQRDAIGPMNSAIHRPLNQHQVNAIASACINCGPGFIYGTVGRLINAGDLRGAADWFLRWSTPPVLHARRVAERALFLSSVPHLPLPWLTVDERRWCLEYDHLGHSPIHGRRRRVLKRTMAAQAARIQYAARHAGGWDRANRRQRFHSLVARAA